MVSEKTTHKKHKHRENGDGALGTTTVTAAKDVDDGATKLRSAADEPYAGPATDVDDEEPQPGEDQPQAGEEEVEECERGPDGKCKQVRHIHPCICDLSKRTRQKIDAHYQHKRLMQRKYDRRVKEIEEELARLEEERLEREREMQEQQELFGDEYELVGTKRKRKKRSARRASMVSLGVKQVINWHKEPRIEVKDNKVSTLRKKFTSYCGRHVLPPSPTRSIDFHKEPTLAIRTTVASDMRFKVNIEKKNWLIEHEDKRPIFDTPYYV